MPTQKPRSCSLKDLILVGSIVKFTLSVTAAILMRQRNGTVNGVVNDTLWAIAVVLVVQGFLGSVASWVDSRKQDERLHETLEEWDALWATNSSGNTNSAQLSIIGPVDVMTTGNGQDRQADTDQSVTAADPSATTNPNTPSPTIVASTCSSTFLLGLGEPVLLSQVENSGQNEGSIRITNDDAKQETQQLRPAPTQKNITMDVAPSGTDHQSSTFPPAPDISMLADTKGTNEESIVGNPAATDKGVGMDTHGNKSRSTEEIGLLSLGAGPNTIAVRGNNQYSEETDVGRSGMIAQDDPLTKGVTSSILVASSTRSATDSSLPSQAEDLEATPGVDAVAAGQYKEQIVVIHDSPLTVRNTDVTPSTAGRRFPLIPDEVAKGEK
ncbi:hypothetical protein BDP27DRAFT_1368234 [Rhodocollybia butyracea]|uniref:Transmembrane protein n=1 Tax=Rhodocollybia butyracea TaxID=206335 RepID=A0A9P5PHA9_9AGAR|nr:hypothetical protein BDP27DRAFT_1368234 [Rhodocollybia butyracea]